MAEMALAVDHVFVAIRDQSLEYIWRQIAVQSYDSGLVTLHGFQNLT